jgi:hypothetical protein
MAAPVVFSPTQMRVAAKILPAIAIETAGVGGLVTD